MKKTANGVVLGPVEYRVLFDLGSRKLRQMGFGFGGTKSVKLEPNHIDVICPEVGGRATITYDELEREAKRVKRNPIKLLLLFIK